jgi:nitrate/TMAO reductase-like tetraheme cytochrome c subunit
MYPAGKIDAACRGCHKSHNAPAAKVIVRWQQRCPAQTDPQEIRCTDCHGEHRLKLRTVRWNKETGKLLSREDSSGKKSAP